MIRLHEYVGGKVEEKKIWKKRKDYFKFNKLIIYVYLNSFYLFLYIILKLKF